MLRHLSAVDATPLELRELVKWSVDVLGKVIQREAGERLFILIESMRSEMAALRDHSDSKTISALEKWMKRLQLLDKQDRLLVARAYTLMLELINVCENAYRSYRLVANVGEKPRPSHFKPDTVIYVLTAHPTEARSPESISVFHSVQRTLIARLRGGNRGKPFEMRLNDQLFHELELAWRVSIMRERAPKVRNEAEHIYSTLLEDSTLSGLLDSSSEIVPVYIRSWVGGDKDGHPGVDEKIMLESLSISRNYLIRYCKNRLSELRETLELLDAQRPLLAMQTKLIRLLSDFRSLRAGDGGRIIKLRENLIEFSALYGTEIGALHPSLKRLRQLLHVFPGLVVPLELRESSDVLMADPTFGKKLAIDRMLSLLAKISQGGDPRWYARGFIVSMTSAIEHLQVAESKVSSALSGARIPIIPLFEQSEPLAHSSILITQMIHDKKIGRDIRKFWNNTLEMMVGYSDSSKESGVFPSRLAIAEAMIRLDRLCKKEGVTPLFFQGSGGSIDRGGGSVQDQTAWWPHSALRNYKVTIQGEMVERSFSTPEIMRGQIERIVESVGASLARTTRAPQAPILKLFSEKISSSYREMVENAGFLEIVESATPYPDLSALKIGSRPTRRKSKLSVKGLRAIPWVLCWTQTRVLFQTWWGVGTAWNGLKTQARRELKAAFKTEPVFASYIRALGFTLAKVQLPVWKIYLNESGLDQKLATEYYKRFKKEYEGALELVAWISGSSNPLWFRPWLGASIRLRSPMIHPLNLLQVIAIQEKDAKLLRCTVTGIASGMLTTG